VCDVDAPFAGAAGTAGVVGDTFGDALGELALVELPVSGVVAVDAGEGAAALPPFEGTVVVTVPLIFSFAFGPFVPRASRVALDWATAAAFASAVLVTFFLGVQPKSANTEAAFGASPYCAVTWALMPRSTVLAAWSADLASVTLSSHAARAFVDASFASTSSCRTVCRAAGLYEVPAIVRFTFA
jgi:hypothetical protein